MFSKQHSGPNYLTQYNNFLYSYVACTYGGMQGIDIMMDESNDNNNYPFMHPEGPSPFSVWLQQESI
jgi:hypothetical protein